MVRRKTPIYGDEQSMKESAISGTTGNNMSIYVFALIGRRKTQLKSAL